MRPTISSSPLPHLRSTKNPVHRLLYNYNICRFQSAYLLLVTLGNSTHTNWLNWLISIDTMKYIIYNLFVDDGKYKVCAAQIRIYIDWLLLLRNVWHTASHHSYTVSLLLLLRAGITIAHSQWRDTTFSWVIFQFLHHDGAKVKRNIEFHIPSSLVETL